MSLRACTLRKQCKVSTFASSITGQNLILFFGLTIAKVIDYSLGWILFCFFVFCYIVHDLLSTTTFFTKKVFWGLTRYNTLVMSLLKMAKVQYSK